MKFISYVLVLFLALSIVTTGCTSKKEAVDNQDTKIAETTEKNDLVEEIETSENNDDTNVSVKSDSKTQWPKDISSFFPKLNGKIVDVIEDIQGDLVHYTVFFDELKSVDMDAFVNEIEAKPGWKIITKDQTDDMWSVMAVNEKKEAKLLAVFEGGLSGGMMVIFDR